MAIDKKISQLTAKVTNIKATDLMEVSEYSGGVYTTKSITGAQIVPYKSYITKISQTSTSAPTVIGGYSQLTGTLTFTRSAVGTYVITNSVAEFTANNTFVFLQMGIGSAVGFYQVQFVSTTEIYLFTFNIAGAGADSLLANSCLEIKIIN